MLNRLSGMNVSSRISMKGSHYYFSRLNEEQKQIYKSMLSGIRTYSKEVKLPARPINEISTIFNYILLDNPMIFYASSFNQSSDLYKKKCTLAPEYKYTCREVNEKANTIKTYLQVFETVKAKSDNDKELYVHDYCLNHFSYDSTFSDYSHSVLGPVFSKTAVCEGIANFVKLAFDYLGMKSLIVSGKATTPNNDPRMENHAWNIVRVDGKLYHLDVTFDMTLKDKVNRYDYFNLPDEDIKQDHIIIDDLPVCKTTGADYYSQYSLVVHDLTGLESFIGRNLKAGNKSIVFRLVGIPYTEDIADKVIQIAQQQYIKIHNKSVAVEVSFNPSQMVFEIYYK